MKDIMTAELARIKEQIRDLEQQLTKLPEGTFYTAQNGKYTKWFRYIDGRNELIKKKDRSLAEALAMATYIRFQIKELRKESIAVNAYLHNASGKDIFRFFMEHPGFRELLKSPVPMSEKCAKWAAAPYKKPDTVYKGTFFKTIKGDLVKSHAEQMIADALYLAGIPYRYECGLSFNGGKTWYYPDFTIMNPRTGKIFLWEHFGMEELDRYRRKNADKIYVYFENGIVPGKNLICTVSNDQIHLTPAIIQTKIHEYLA